MSQNLKEKVIRVGSRKSELALIQTKHVISRLQKLYPEKKFEIHTMSTIGDRVLNVSLPKIGEKSLFTRDLEDALRNGGVDFVVHSLKDLPTALPIGMAIGAILEREDSRDALVLNEKYKGKTINTLPKGCVIGTSSLRRTAQLRRLYPHLEVCDIRGNLNTRLAKLDLPNSKFAGIILAQAGLLRMGWMNRISQVLEPTDLLYAVGQGALAVECRSNDFENLAMLQSLMCLPTTCRILAERSFLKTLGGGCSAPVAVSTNIKSSLENNNQDELQLDIIGAVWSLDGQTEIRDSIEKCIVMETQSERDEEIDEDVSPQKKSKPNEADENLNEKQDSPKVVNDDKFLSSDLGAGDSSNISSLKYLIDVHSDLFKKCPFYSVHQKDKENGNGNGTAQDECPLKIPVGQDFMGKCPYFDTEKQVEFVEKLKARSCPITSNIIRDLQNIKNQNETNKTNCDETDFVKEAQQSKCPFTASTSKTKHTPRKLDQFKPESCPFLKQSQTIKLIDYETSKPILNENPPQLIDDSEELFCGLFRHKCYKLNLFANCEKLGKQLAMNLINRGALDVMKCAQDEIREKI